MDNIKRFIDCVKSDNGRLAGSLFTQSIKPKMLEKLNILKIELVKDMFSTKKVKNVNEEVLLDIENIVSSEQPGKVTLSNGEVFEVDVPTANTLLTVINALEQDMKEKFLDKINNKAEDFLQAVNFSWKQVE